MLQRLTRLFHTVKYLKFKQIAYRIYYRSLNLFRYRDSCQPEKKEISVHWPETIRPIPNKISWQEGKFTFVGISHNFNGLPEWDYPAFGKLWTYNLNYFDFLNQPGFPRETGLELINHFIGSLHPRAIALEPYPTSLRGINWIRFLSDHRINDHHIINSLYHQYCHLSRHCEYHLLGNHLLENGFSLFTGGTFFQELKFLTPGEKILRKELEEQILPDGGHFELSPMYHQIIFSRLLDTINLLKNNKFPKSTLLPFLEKKAQAMASWLTNLTWRNGNIPMVNDAAPDIASTTTELLAYYKKLDIKPFIHVPLSTSGYRKFFGKRYELVADVGPIGPDYIPGHGHADMFHFDIQVDEVPFLTDTGTSTYENNEVRHHERSSRAHNTVTCLDQNQSDVWGSFRVGKRGAVTVHADSVNLLKASHSGYKGLGIIHERTFQTFEDHIIIDDKLSGNGKLPGKAGFHLAPGIIPTINGNRVKTHCAELEFNHAKSIFSEDCEIAVSFNQRARSIKIVVEFEEHLKTTITF